MDDVRAALRHAAAWAALVIPAAGDGPAALDGELWPARDAIAAAARGRAPAFGAAVAIDGDLCLVGAPRALAGGAPAGEARTALRTPAGTWLASPRPLDPPRGVADGARFGAAVALGGGLAAVGAPRASGPGGPRSGLVALYRIDAGTGRAGAAGTLAPPAGWSGSDFGAALAIGAGPDGVRVAVGAPYAAAPDGTPHAGAVLVFVADGGGWRLERTLRAPEPRIAAAFGRSLVRAGGLLVVGAPGDGGDAPGAGRVLAFGPGRDPAWEVGPGPTAAGARFGAALAALDGGRVAIGAPGRGAVEVVAPGPAGVALDAILRGDVLGGFGGALARLPGGLAVGAPLAGRDACGRVVLLARSRDGGWERRASLAARRATAGAAFGVALASWCAPDGDARLVVGEPESDAPCPATAGECAAGRAVVYLVSGGG